MAVTITGTGDISVTGNIEGNNISANTNLLFGNKVQPQAGTSVTPTGTHTSSTVDGDTVLVFTGDGTLTVSNMLGIPARILVVGGGGGGGNGKTSGGAGGGGAGQFIDTNIILPPGTINIKIGAGGSGGTVEQEPGENGEYTSIGHIYALGGGGGGASPANAYIAGFGRVGASTGGIHGSYYATGTWELAQRVYPPLAGNYGGRGRGLGGGGGAGAGTDGNSSNPSVVSTNTGGNGGDGLISNITGTNVYYAAGGGGGAWATTTPGGVGGLGGGGNGSFGNVTGPTVGAPNTGSGGGGGNNYHGFVGAAGGSGIVIVRYRL